MLDRCTDIVHLVSLISPFIAGHFTQANLLMPRTPVLGYLLSFTFIFTFGSGGLSHPG